MKTIYKYPIESIGETITMPTGAIVISAAVQGDEICLWAEVDTDNKKEVRRFEVFCTGEGMPRGNGDAVRIFIATVFRGPYVFHVYERTK